MAKLNDLKIRQKLNELSVLVKAKKITQSQRWKEYNEVVTELLQDDTLNAKYTAMAVAANSEDPRLSIGEESGVRNFVPYMYVHYPTIIAT